MSDLNVALILRVVDRATGPLRKVSGALGETARRARQFDTRAAIARNNQRMLGYGAEAAGIAAIGYAAVKALGPSIQFESALAGVGKVVDFQGEGGLALLGHDISELSKRIPIAAEGIAEIVEAAGQANVVDAALPDDEKRRQLIAFTEAAAKMGVAFDMSAGEAGGAMAKLRAQFRLGQDGVISVADAVNHLSNKLDAKAPQLLDVMRRAAGTASAFGLSAQQTAALGASMLALGTPAEVAGTGINAILMKMKTATKQGKPFQGALEELGLSAQSLETAIADDAQGALIAFLETMEGRKDQLHILSDLFGMEYADDVARMVGGLDQYRRATALIGDSADYAGAMQQEFLKQSNATANKLGRFMNRLVAMQRDFTTALLPAFNDLLDTISPYVDALGAWAQANPEAVSAAVELAAALLAIRGALLITKILFGGWIGVVLRVVRVLVPFKQAFVGAFRLVLGSARLFGRLFTGVFARVGTLIAGSLGGTVGAILGPVTLIAGAAYLIWSHWAPISEFFTGLWSDVSGAFSQSRAAGDTVAEALGAAAVEALKGAWRGLVQLFDWAWRGIVETFEWARPLIDAVSTALGGPTVAQIQEAWRPLGAFFTELWDGIKDAFKAAWALIEPIVNRLGSAIDTISKATDVSSILPSWLGGEEIEARAGGGPVRAGGLYLVGERGPELVRFGASGHVLNAARTAAALSAGPLATAPIALDHRPALSLSTARGGGGGGVSVGAIHIHAAPGMSEAEIAREVRRQLAEMASGARDLHDQAGLGR